MAWRNVWRNSRRSAVTIAAMAFALWVMVLYSGLISGYLVTMESDVLDYEVGDIQAFPEGYRDDPTLFRRIEDPTAKVEALEAAGFRVEPRLLGAALAASGEQSSGVQLRGIDVARDKQVLRVWERVAEGEWLDPADPGGVVLGRRLARTLGVKPGGELLVLSQGADGSMANDLYRVRGVLGPVGEATDRAAVFLTEQAFRKLMVVPDGASQLIVRVPPGQPDLDAAEAEVAKLVPGAEVLSWRRLMPTVATMLDSAAAMIYLIFGIVYVAVGILVLNAMLMAVFERIREFGVMKALGVGPWLVARLILIEAALQVAVAVVIAMVLAAPMMWYLQNVGLDMSVLSGASVVGLNIPAIWTGVYDVQTVSAPLVVLLFITGVAVTIPAVRAATLRPVEAMRYQ
ncbi:MAG: FtsX-like permease family protein [Myxococcota bacterium]